MNLQEHEIKDRIWFEKPVGRFAEAIFENEHGEGRISLYGGHLLNLTLKPGDGALWLSPEAIYREGKAIRGGVPLVFPWFGSHPKDDTLPAHGFARISHWKIHSTKADAQEVSLTLALEDTVDTRALWPHFFQARLTTTLNSRGLHQGLHLTNTGATDWTWAGGFHPYFAIGNLRSTSVRGLEDVVFVDLLDGQSKQESEPIRFGDEVDRAYTAAPKELVINDATGHRTLVMEPTGSDSTVVWNPGMGKPKSDMPQNGPDRFVCVEPARSAHIKNWSERSTLTPGESTEIAYRVHIRHV